MRHLRHLSLRQHKRAQQALRYAHRTTATKQGTDRNAIDLVK